MEAGAIFRHRRAAIPLKHKKMKMTTARSRTIKRSRNVIMMPRTQDGNKGNIVGARFLRPLPVITSAAGLAASSSQKSAASSYSSTTPFVVDAITIAELQSDAAAFLFNNNTKEAEFEFVGQEDADSAGGGAILVIPQEKPASSGGSVASFCVADSHRQQSEGNAWRSSGGSSALISPQREVISSESATASPRPSSRRRYRSLEPRFDGDKGHRFTTGEREGKRGGSLSSANRAETHQPLLASHHGFIPGAAPPWLDFAQCENTSEPTSGKRGRESGDSWAHSGSQLHALSRREQAGTVSRWAGFHRNPGLTAGSVIVPTISSTRSYTNKHNSFPGGVF
ncbi:unnamed protein product [Amoebophrya sp. A25]|nr:unnamed protein product [Amoebophrya sp. A25]|eukprot:GSA25T00005440001.1